MTLVANFKRQLILSQCDFENDEGTELARSPGGLTLLHFRGTLFNDPAIDRIATMNVQITYCNFRNNVYQFSGDEAVSFSCPERR